MFYGHKITVIIPALNEEESLPKVIDDIPKDIVDEIIVVDNGSLDNTISVAEKCGAKVVIEKKRGYGAACLKGLASLKNTDIVVILDADYSDYPGQIERLLAPIVKKDADFVIGSRILGKRQRDALLPAAYWGNKLTTFLIWLLFRFKFSDMGPFRAIRYDCLKRLEMEDENWGWNVEMQVKALKAKLRIKEVGVDYRKRIGKSKISGTLSGVIKAGLKIIYSVFKYSICSQPQSAESIENSAQYVQA